MAERLSGYYWVRFGATDLIAAWDGRWWWVRGVPLKKTPLDVLYGPIPGPEELRRLVGEKEAGR